MSPQVKSEIEVIRKRRNIEYIFLLSIQGFLGANFSDFLVPFVSIGIAFSSLGLGWTLTAYRESRRTLPKNSKYRVLAEIIESLLILLFISLFGIAAYAYKVSIIVFQAHLSIVFFCYWTACCFAEAHWVYNVLPKSGIAEQLNYLSNLGKSVILPLDFQLIKRTFRIKTK